MDITVDIRAVEIPGSLFLLRNMPILIFHLFGDRPPLIKQTDKSLQTERTLKSKVVYFFN